MGETFGPSQRFTMDWSNIDGSTENIVLGESGNPYSPYYPRPVERLLQRPYLCASVHASRGQRQRAAHAAPVAMKEAGNRESGEVRVTGARSNLRPGERIHRRPSGLIICLAAFIATIARYDLGQFVRSRFRFPSGFVDRCAGSLAARSLLSALGAQSQLGCRRTAFRFLSAADVDAWRGVRHDLSVEGCAARNLLFLPRRDRTGDARTGAPVRVERGPATLAGCAALFSGYSMFTAYERSAFGELAGGFWIPLLLLLILRDRNPQGSVLRRALRWICRPARAGDCGRVALECPLGVMASYLLAAVALVVALIRRHGPRFFVPRRCGTGHWPLRLLSCSRSRGAALGADPQAVDDPGLAIENSFLFARHADPNLELHDVELLRVSIIAVIMLGIAFLWHVCRVAAGKLPRSRAVDPARADSGRGSLSAVPHFAATMECPAEAALPAVPVAMAGCAGSPWRSSSPPRCGPRGDGYATRDRGLLRLLFSAITALRCSSSTSAVMRKIGLGMLGHIAAAKDSKALMSTHRRARTTRSSRSACPMRAW